MADDGKIIEMPPFRKIYKNRDGVDKFYYDKISEIVDVINEMYNNSEPAGNEIPEDPEDG